MTYESRSALLARYLWGARQLPAVALGPHLRPDQLERMRDRRLRRLVNHAYSNVPYYRALLDRAGVMPLEIVTASDLKLIPVTRKANLRGPTQETLLARGVNRSSCLAKTSSGSSGMPLTVYRESDSVAAFLALTVRALRAAGARPTDTTLVIGPAYYPQGLLIQRLGIGAIRFIPALRGPEELARALEEERPQVLHAYASSLKSLIAWSRETGLPLHRPRVLVSSADFLEPQTRRDCVEMFGSEPFEMYGAVETGRVAGPCPQHTGLHIYSDYVIAELIPLEGDGDVGAHRLILTDLTNHTMPFIRYDSGDLVEPLPDPCPCGSPFPRMRLLHARSSEVIRRPDGGLVSAFCLGIPLWEIPGINDYRIVQTERAQLVVELVRGAGYRPEAEPEALARLAGLLPGMEVSSRYVEQIARAPSGKTIRFRTELGTTTGDLSTVPDSRGV